MGLYWDNGKASSRMFGAPGDKLRLYLVIGCDEAEQPHATESTAKKLAPGGDSGYIFQPPTTPSSLDSRPSDKENTLLQSVCGRRNNQFLAARADLLAETLRSILLTSGGDVVPYFDEGQTCPTAMNPAPRSNLSVKQPCTPNPGAKVKSFCYQAQRQPERPTSAMTLI